MGMTMKLTATVICSADDNKTRGLCCCAFEKYTVGAEEVSLITFEKDAVAHFEQLGWDMRKFYCPRCAKEKKEQRRKKGTK